MLEVTFECQSRYPVGRKIVTGAVSDLLVSRGLKDQAAVSIFVCGRRKMRELSRRYLRAVEDHEVLSFTYSEVKKEFVDFPDEVLRLGDVVVCFPMARDIAREENKMVDEVIAELACHGTLHLLGEHHGEVTSG